MTLNPLALTKVCLFLMNILDVSWHGVRERQRKVYIFLLDEKKSVRRNKAWIQGASTALLKTESTSS